MKKRVTATIVCAMMLVASCFAFAACGGGGGGVANEVWKIDATRGTSEYANQHTYFAKLGEEDAVVMVYSTDSQDKTRITAFAAFVCTYSGDGNDITVTPTNGCIHAMNGDNPIDMTFDADGVDTWWSNTVGESKNLKLSDDGTFEVATE